MKTITEYKDAAAAKYGYKDFLDVLKLFDCAKTTYSEVNTIINEAMQEYAKKMCGLQIEACAENELVKSFCDLEFETDNHKFIKEYLKQTPNVVTTK